MVNVEIVRYISSNLKRGIPFDQIYQSLLMRGWSDFEIKQAHQFVLSGKTIERKEVSTRKYTPNQFLLILAVSGFIVFMFIIFGIIFSESGEKQYNIDASSLSSSVISLEMMTNSRVVIENFQGGNYNFTVKYKSGIFNFNDGYVAFSLSFGQDAVVDLNGDGTDDLIFEFTDAEKMIIQVRGICHESWSCSAWGECLFDKKIRACVDVNSCGTEMSKPELEMACVSENVSGLPSSNPITYEVEVVTEENYTYYVPYNSTNSTNITNSSN